MSPKSFIVLFVLLGLGLGVFVVSTLQAPSAAVVFSRVHSSSDQAPMHQTQHINPEQLAGSGMQEVSIIDVRTREEYADGHIEGARNIDFTSPSFSDEVIRTLEKDRSYVLYCRSGRRSALAAERMRELGFTNVVDLSGGVLSWEQTGHSLCTNC